MDVMPSVERVDQLQPDHDDGEKAARSYPVDTDSGVHVVRTLADARALRAALERDAPVVVVGLIPGTVVSTGAPVAGEVVPQWLLSWPARRAWLVR